MVLQALPSAKETAPHAHTNHGRQKWKQACATVNVIEKKCTFCNRENHSAFKCDTFRNLPVNQRYDKVKEKGLCINCLAPDHRVRECTSCTCRVCKLKHHTMLHRTPIESSSTVAASVPESTVTTSTRATSFIEPNNTVMLTPTANQLVPTTSILLPTVLLTVVASNGNKMIARALLDGGAQVNLITERLVQGLRAQRLRDHLAIGAVARAT
ncbi:uncharacterized protein LOC120900050 [Anopheles arabiensis]|uniref:uncharacterized protein LOC120900050 n=1 Tax=Anopheles arabiensis TaxID=7173 RepID=UPI001AAC7AA5|nr:uncharacterized protein LOC120900050 [Anopheles arabiensis]